jgi:hypothetical protein
MNSEIFRLLVADGGVNRKSRAWIGAFLEFQKKSEGGGWSWGLSGPLDESQRVRIEESSHQYAASFRGENQLHCTDGWRELGIFTF